MKRKLLFAIVACLCSITTWARTDVTSTYLTDAALENEGTNWALVSNGGNHKWDGTNKYHESWHNTFTISQTTAALPAGYYQVSIQAAVEGGYSTTISLQATSGSNSSVAVYPKYSTFGSYADMAAWWAADASHTENRDLNRIFTTVYVEEGQTLTVTFKQTANDQWFVYGQMQLHELTDAEGRYAQIFEAAYNSKTNLDMASGRFKQRFESYTGGDVSSLTGKKLNKTISDLPKGKYNVTLNGGASYAENGGVSGGGEGDNKTKFFANDASTNVTVVKRTNIGNDAFTDYTATNALVTDGNLEIGFNNVAAGANWFVGSVKYIEYVDPYVSELAIGPFTSGNTLEAGEWYSYTVPTDGDYTLSATEGVVYAVSDVFVSEANSEAKNATSTVALPAGTVYFKSNTSQALTISYVEPVVANGEYYLYNAATQKFLSRGADFGARSTIDIYGIPVVWNNYTKCLQFKDTPSLYLFFDNTTPAGSWTYTDGGSDKEFRYFAFEAVKGGYILKDNNSTACLWTEDNAIVMPTAIANKANAIVWQLKTKSERDAIVAAYPASNKTAVIKAASLTSETDAAGFETWLAANRAAKDKTSEVGTAKFTSAIGSWTWTEKRGQGGQPAYGTDWAEIYQATGDFSQEITGLSEGIYKVTVNAFERETGYATCNTLGEAGYEITTAYFEANAQKVQLKSWYSDKTGTNDPDNTTQAATAFNNDKYKNEVYCYVGDDGKLTLKLAKPSYASGSWVLFNNVTLTYYDTDVDDDDATAILAEATTTMESPMKHSLYAALSTAKETFDGSRTVPNYNALRTAIDNTATSIASYANMYTNYLEPLNTYFATTNFVQSDAYNTYLGYKDSYDNYKTTGADVENATANALSITKGYGTDYTSTYSLMMLPNWTKNGTAALSNSGFKVNTWSTENKGTGDAVDFANPFYEYFVGSGSLAATTLTGTLTGLNANTAYDVTANVRVQGSSKVAGSITMEVEGGVPVDVTAGDAIMDGETPTGRYIKSFTATGVTDGSGNLVLKFNVAANSNVSWLAFRDVNYATSAATPSNDFTDLNTAISTAEAKTLGFENGEYAPYNNVDALEALAAAKSLTQDRYYISSVITDATTALTGASWTANLSDVDAIYNQDFSEGGWEPTAWTSTGWAAKVDDINTNSEISKTGKGWRPNTGTITYGNTGVYTMPLDGNQLYKLTFKYGAWDQLSVPTISVLNAEDGLAATALAGTNTNYKTAMTSQTMYFKTGAAGNYILSMNATYNMVWTDVSLVKADESEIMMAETATTAPANGYYQTMNTTRTLVGGQWNGFSVPFGFTVAGSALDGAEVKQFASASDNVITLADASEIVAGEPYLVKPTANIVNPSFNGVTVSNPVAAEKGEDYKLKAHLYYSEALPTDGIAYVSTTDSSIKKLTSGKMKGMRSIFIIPTGNNVKPLNVNFGDDTTGIMLIDAEGNITEGAIYNLAGQRVNKVQKGIYIQNGKKIYVK